LEDNYCDVVLCVGDKEFLGHRCVIGQLSKMLDKMFKIKVYIFVLTLIVLFSVLHL